MDKETTSSGLPQSRRWQAAFWAGVGVLVAGIGVLGYAVGVADDVYPTRPGDPPYTTVLEQYWPGVALGFAAVCGVLAVAPVGWALVVAWLGATGRLTAFPRPRFLALVGVLLFAIGIFSFGHWVQVGEVPFPGDRALLVTSAYAIVLVGTVVVRAAATRLWSAVAAPRPWSRRELAAFAGGVMGVVVAAGAVVAVAGEQSRVDATTSAVAQAPAAPADPTRVLWRWSAGTPARPSSAALISESVAAGAGIVVATGDGIVALDGRTGQERWHYRLTDTQYYPDLVAVDGGRGVVASFDGRLHAFDASTGELRWRDDEATAQTPPHWNVRIAATDSTVVRQRYGTAQFAGTDVRTGEVRWQYTLPTPPSQCGDRARAHSLRDTVIIHNELCSDFVDLTALDGATGELLWHKSPLPYDLDVRADMILGESTDVRLQFERSGQESRVGTDDIVLASDSGELITSSGSLYEVGAAEPRWQLPRNSRPKRAWAWYTQAATFLGDAAVLVDRSDDEFRLTIVGRADGTVRRSFEAADLPATRDWMDTKVITAPGGVVVKGSDELVAIG